MHYIFLTVAIVGELVGTTSLKYSEGFTRLWPSIITIVSYAICYYAFSKALLNINLSIAYATWCALGIVVATLLSVFLFRESINTTGVIAIIIITIGVIMLNLSDVSH